MNIIDCIWEITNIGKKTVEISINRNEFFDNDFLREIDSKFEYQVVKVDSGNIEANIQLEKNGFHLIETQIEVEKKLGDFNFNDSLVKYIEPDVSFLDVKSDDVFDAIFERMTPDMFITDRIAVDPYFGLNYSYKRYCSWMRTAFESQSASFFEILYKGEHIGFSMYRVKDKIWHGDLGGLYPGYGQGLGLLTACGAFLYMRQRGMNITKLVSNISSNNVSVIPTFNYCHYNFKKFVYVFVKHNFNVGVN